MRGKAKRTDANIKYLRITPAYAGKRDPQTVMVDCSIGSPPPMRGKVSLVLAECSLCRITPAYAGKSKTLDKCGEIV